jgi:hypothetical protein
MRNTDSAALVLSLVTSQERADSMVGDLLEGDGASNPAQFWFAVVRTALAQLWRQIAAAPFSMIRTAILGMCAEFACLLVAVLAAFMMLLGVVSVSRVVFHYDDLPDWLFRWVPNLLYSFWVPFALGRWMFRRCPGREAMGTLTLAVLHASIGAVWILWQATRAGAEEAHIYVTAFVRVIYWDGDIIRELLKAAFYLTLYPVTMLAGAASARAKSLQSRRL